jgi:glyoxylase-like metal-dependent hydrolase (beta-lactamase superfamily II)
MKELVRMDSPVEGLHASAPMYLPFAPSLDVRAFLLERDQGNILVYSVSGLESDAAAIEDLGGISRHYLNHGHEALFASDWVSAPLFVHEHEREAVEKSYRVRGTFSRRHMLDDDFEVIPTPGHTPGATSFLWRTPEHRILFTGDTVFVRDGEWVAAFLDDVSDRPSYLQSLDLLAGLEFDVLAPGIAPVGEPPVAFTDPDDARERIGRIAERLRSGQDQ